MYCIKDEDYEYIMHKYADDPQSIVSRSRFVRQDKIFDPKTGLDGDLIVSELCKLDENKTLDYFKTK